MYTIIKASSEVQLIKDVNQLIAEGWTVSGGLSVAFLVNSEALFFAQALVK